MSKYKAVKKVVDFIKFDSTVEANYYLYLKDLKSKGLILNFERQPKYILQDKFIKNNKKYRAIEYKADFLVYNLDGSTEVIDIKGIATAEAKLKRKMYLYKYDVPLKWLVWNHKTWRDYDEVQREKRSK